MDDALDDPVDVLLAPCHVPRGGAEPASEPRGRVQVGQVEPAGEPHGLIELVQELVPVPAPPADGRAHDDVVYHAADGLAEVDGLAAAAALAGDGAEEARYLLLPDGAEGEHAALVEELEHAHLAELAPAVVVVGEDDVLAAAADDVEGGAQVAAAEGDVVRPHHLPGGLGGGDHQRRNGAEAEQHERPVRRGQLAQCLVRQQAADEARQEEVVQAADERQLPWPRREAKRRRRLCPDELEDEEEEDEDWTQCPDVHYLAKPAVGAQIG